jgi:type III pantothenate kinase
MDYYKARNMILCDIGNSSYHFFKDGISSKMNLDTSPKIRQNSDKQRVIYYISVNKEAENNLLKYNKCINLENYISINSNYNKNNLGIDRKMACYNQENKIIVDAGSAITVDIVHNNKHLGGFILNLFLVF